MRYLFQIIGFTVVILFGSMKGFSFNDYEMKILNGLEEVKNEKVWLKRDSLTNQVLTTYYLELNSVLLKENNLALDTYLTEVAEGHLKMSSGLRRKIQKKYGTEFYTKAYWLLVDLRLIEVALKFDYHKQAIFYEKNKHEGHCECGKCGNG